MHELSPAWVAVAVSELLAVQIIVNAGLDVLFCVIVDDKGFLPIVMITILVFPVPGEGYFVVEFHFVHFMDYLPEMTQTHVPIVQLGD